MENKLKQQLMERMSGKIAFDTYEEAREELERIVTTKNHKPWKKSDKKSCRVYEENGKWYLTSKPIISEISDN